MSYNFKQIAESMAPADGSYRAWVTCAKGTAPSFKIVPAISSGMPTRGIPYLQAITTEFYPQSEQLCLICHGTAMLIFIEGRGLEKLADLIGERCIHTISVYDPEKHTSLPDSQQPVITNITVEQSS